MRFTVAQTLIMLNLRAQFKKIDKENINFATQKCFQEENDGRDWETFDL